jgi:uncharacterized protein with PIN domain
VQLSLLRGTSHALSRARATRDRAPSVAALAAIARMAFLLYGRGRHPAAANLSDCASYALAKQRNLPLLFKGDDFPGTDLRRAA